MLGGMPSRGPTDERAEIKNQHRVRQQASNGGRGEEKTEERGTVGVGMHETRRRTGRSHARRHLLAVSAPVSMKSKPVSYC